jgi:hypothetical protein
MRPGQRVARPKGSIEISTFARSEDGKTSTFTVEFLLRNDSREVFTFNVEDYVRLIADDVPYSPTTVSPGFTTIRPESVQYARVSFRTRGRPQIVTTSRTERRRPGRSGDP